MNFNKLQEQEKELMSEKLNKFCELFGGANAFLQVIETIKDEKPHPLLNKTSIYHTQLAKLSWSKSLFKETLNKIFDCIKHEDKEGDIFANLSPKDY